MPDQDRLGIMAGAGSLPRLIVETAERQGRPIFLIGFAGHVDPTLLAGRPHLAIRIGKAGAIVKALRRNQVKTVVMAGAIRRPGLNELRPDWYAARFLMRHAGTIFGPQAVGDDRLLTTVTRAFEAEGFTVASATDLVDGLTVGQGLLGSLAPDAAQVLDIQRGINVVKAIGLADIGQAGVIQNGLVLGVEGAEGTDRLIQRCGELKRPGPGPVLVKLAKPQQDMRVDMPTIGPDTIATLAAAGFAGVAIEADKTIVLDIQRVIEAAERHKLFVTAIQA